ncbi:Polycystic kidney disease 1 like 1 [Nibea albiflora]|uniref:Polycystic kidney disease 1 like 1 n=1 Tax=Nibea albiflora TaxID=240163 RepID=A0ACB7F4Z8_NIBAL|nr:Polycystic kidney disease 1 like 1 [Nibea albiflora]
MWIYAEKQAYPTNTDITFLALAEVPDPVEFLWHFGDSGSVRTTSRTVTRRYHKPGRYDVFVVLLSGRTSLTSDVFPLVVQRAVKLNRLLHQASVLLNQTVTLSCRLNVGTDVSFLWDFGDGSHRLGQSTEQHVFHRTGEFTVTVTVSNLVSSATLSSHIFVVDRPCQPPPVKNMGPLKLQVRRYESIRLGVTYETEVDCDISGGLHYTWTLFDSAGRVFPLPLIDTHRQSLVLPSHLLHYDTYSAIARVQVNGSVVYSNYSVRVQVIPSPPVAFIQGGTNIFINNRNNTVVTLDGQRSYDPDSPMSLLSFSWTCKPVSSITSSCFHQDVPTSSPVLAFPASFLKHNFDQFQFTLTIHSGDRSASSEIFLTLTSNVDRKVSVYCPRCQGDEVNWDQSFSVSALCESCGILPKDIQYTWSLYLVNASSKPVIDVPFCYTVDLSAPSSIMEGPATPPQTPLTSTLHAPATDASQYTSAPIFLIENAVETRAKELHVDEVDSVTLSKSTMAGEEPFYHPLGEFDPPELLYSSTEYQPLALDNSGVLFSDHFGQSDVISEFPVDLDSSADWEFSFPVLESGDLGGRLDSDYDVSLTSAEEGDPGISAGRPTGVDGESFNPGNDSLFDPALHEDQGSNLVDSRPSVVIQQPILLDLPRVQVDRGLFESYTDTGIFSPLLSFRPFSLRPGSRYMLEVTAKSHDGLLGRTQLFLKTNPAPKGMTCQDLVYEYSIAVGDRPPRVLYQGRDFQYYSSLPSGDPDDDYKVTIHTVIRSSTYGTATKPCPVTVRVQPGFFRDPSSSSHLDPDVELSESVLRNLSALVQLGNRVEVRNYISLISSILNRLSLDTKANTQAQRRTRNVLICTACELESREQESMVDTICILKDLLQVTSQVSLASARRVTLHVQIISEHFSESSARVRYYMDQKTLNTLVALLSYSLQAAVTGNNLAPEMSNSVDIKQALESGSHEENIRNAIAPSNGSIPDSSSGVYIKRRGSISTKQAVQLVADILQTASDLMLKYILFHEAQEHRVSTGLITLYAAYQNQTSTVIRGGSTIFYMPPSLIQILFVHHSRKTESRAHRPCALRILTELTQSPYTWAHYPGRLSGPVVDLSLYECSTRRKIPVRSLIQPINIELQQPPRNKSSVHEHVLWRSQVNYHSFNITQEHLQQSIQLSVVFSAPLNKPFPIMLLFRMFKRPTPSMHHLHRIHHWESNTTRFTLPSSYLSGVGHLALLTADFGKVPRHKHLSEQVSYSLTVDSNLCLSWDAHQGAWTHHGCRTQQADKTTAANCSCHQLRPLTVMQRQISSSHDTTDLDPFLSVSSDLTVLGVLVLCVCLYIPALVLCKRADVISEANQKVHYLPDSSPCDPYLYAVTIHTGPCSAACMSAKVYIVLNGEDGISQTRELQMPGCTLFRRNSRDTFIISAADSLGPLWGIHIWHDNSGPSPDWYLKQVEICELPFELGIIDVSAVSMTTGVLSAVAVLPVAAIISFLFRLREDTALLPASTTILENKNTDKEPVILIDAAIRESVAVESLPITEGNNVNQAPQGKESDLLSESIAFYRSQKALLSDTRDGDEEPQGKRKEGGHQRKTWPGHSSCHHVTDRLKGSGLRPISRWSHYLAWILCLLLSLLFLILSAVLGTSCLELVNVPGTSVLVRPPTPADLRKIRRKKRRETLIHNTLRSDAASKLKLLHSAGWLDRQTVAVEVHFTLFSPAPNLFTSVTMLAEQSPTGVLLPSAKVQSVRVYHTPAVWDYVVMACQLLFLLLSLIQLCNQVYTLGQQGLMGYWMTPCNWLEVSLLTVTLLYYIYYIHHSVIILEVVELLQRHNHRGHVDVSFLATWEQNIRTLRAVTLYLLTMKCVTVLRMNRAMATSATLLTRSLSSLFWPTVSGLVLLVALSCTGNVLLVQSSWAFSSLSRSLQTLLCLCWSPRTAGGLHFSWRDFLYRGVLYLSSTVVWTAVVRSVVSSLVRSVKRSQNRKNVFTVAELSAYIRQGVSEFTGRRRQAWIENHVEAKTYYFEEFESLVDELLFRLNALSNSLHHTLPPKAHRYMEEDSPVISPIQEPFQMDAEDFIRTQITDKTMVSDRTDDSGCGEILPASHLLRSRLEVEILPFLQQRGQRGVNLSSEVVVASDNSQQPGTRAEEKPKDRELQIYFKAQNYQSLPESASLIRVWTEDVLEKQVDQRAETNDSCWLSKSHATHTEVVVEVLVHEEPGSVQTEGLEEEEAAEEDSDEEEDDDDDEDDTEVKEENGVLVLTDSNYDTFMEGKDTVLVEFYAPWCGHCKQFVPEYEKIAQTLKESDPAVPVAKVDATVATELANRFEVSGYPTIKILKNGEPVDYDGDRTEKAIVARVKEVAQPDWKPPPEATLVLTKDNFDETVNNADIILVEFYAPWCGHCKRLAPEYEKAAKELSKRSPAIALAKVDATVEGDIASRFGVTGYPTLKIFRKGKVFDYNGPREQYGIVEYMGEQAGPPSKQVQAVKQVQEHVKDGDDAVIVGVFSSEQDAAYEIYIEACNSLREDFTFRHTFSAEVSQLLKASPGQIVILHPEKFRSKYEPASHTLTMKDSTSVSEVQEFFKKHVTPLVGHRKPSNDAKRYTKRPLVVVYYGVDFSFDYRKGGYTVLRSKVLEVAKDYPEYTFAIADEEDYADELKSLGLSESGEEVNVGILADGGKKYAMEPDEFDSEVLRDFVKAFKKGKLSPIIKSQPVPKNNKGPVKVVVGKTFDDIVMDTQKDVLIEFYAPWCGHCKKLEPDYLALGKKYKGEKNLVIAKMDATANDVPNESYKVEGFPTIYFAPSNSKQSPVKMEGGDRTVEGFSKFLEKHATKLSQKRDEL